MAPPAPPPLTRIAAGGMVWMVANAVASRGASFAAQVVLGWVLSDDDFGLFAIAISFAGIVQVFRDGGLRQVLVHRGTEYPTLRGAFFWMTLALHVLAALVLLALIPAATRLYGAPELMPLLVVLALATPIGAPAAVLLTKLSIDLRFQDVARITGISALLRQGSTVLLALSGFGAMSFVLPLVLTGIYESVAACWATRDAPWRVPAALHLWSGLLRSSKWALLATAAIVLMTSGDYLVLGGMEPKDVVGVYFFAFQLSVQVHTLLLSNLQVVLLPVLAKLRDHPARQVAAFLQAQESTAMLLYPATYGLAVVAEPLERLVWHGQWASAVPVIQILCITLPLRSVAAAGKSAFEANGAFGRFTAVGIADGVANMVAAALGAALGGIISIAIAIAVFMGVGAVGHAAVIARQLGSSSRMILRSHLAPFAAAAVAAAVGFAVRWDIMPVGLVAVRGFAFAAAYLLLARLMMPTQVSRLLGLARGMWQARGGLDPS